MKTRIFLTAFLCFFATVLFPLFSLAQQTTIEYDSDTSPSIGPQLLILEKGDTGKVDPGDGWARLWFQNDSDLSNRWAFLARPHAGASDNDTILNKPIVMAFNASQKFAVASNGVVRINKKYTLPNQKGTVGQVLTIVDTSNPKNAVTDWVDLPTVGGGGSASNIIDADMDTEVYLLEDDQMDTIKFRVNGMMAAEMRADRSSIFTKLDVYDNLNVNGNLTAVGSLNATSNLNSLGNLNLTGELNSVGGNIEIAAGDNLNLLGGNLNVSGAATVIGTSNMGGSVTIANGANLALNGGNINVTGNIGASGGIFCGGVNVCSDKRYKTDINSITNALDILNQINGVSYNYNTADFPEEHFTEKRQLGFLAQEVEKVLPEMVITKEDGYKTVTYDMISPVLVEAIKEQQQLIELLLEQNQNLIQEVTSIKSQLAEDENSTTAENK